MRVVTAGEDVIGSGEVDRQLQRAHIEVHGVVVELAKIFARRLVDVGAAFFEGMKSAIEPLDKVRNRATKVAENPFDAREAPHRAAEYEAGCGERRVERKSDERHQ